MLCFLAAKGSGSVLLGGPYTAKFTFAGNTFGSGCLVLLSLAWWWQTAVRHTYTMLEDNRTILFVNSLTNWSRRLWIPSMMIMARNHLLKKLLPEIFPLTLVNVASSRISKNMLPNISECCLTIVNCPSLLLGCIGWKCSEKRKELRQIKGRGAYCASTT